VPHGRAGLVGDVGSSLDSVRAGARAGWGRNLGACRSHQSAAVKKTARVLVWKKQTGFDQFEEPLSTLYACLLPAGVSVAVGQNAGYGGEYDGGEYEGNVATSGLSIAQATVSDVFAAGRDEQEGCAQYEPVSTCATVVTNTAQVFNLTTGR
jgi:hypothetical protein